MIKSKQTAIQAQVVGSQFGLKLAGVRLPLATLLNRATVQVMTQDPEEEGVQRTTKASRTKGLKDDLRPLLILAQQGREVITEAMHIVLRNPALKFREGSTAKLDDILKHAGTQVSIVDGAGRFYALADLVQEDEAWADLVLYAQIYLNPTRVDEIRLMEILNGKRSKLEKNFSTSLEARYYNESDTGIEPRHIISALAVQLANDRGTPLYRRTKFHYSEHAGASISSVSTAVKVSLKRAGLKTSMEYEDLHMILRASLRALAEVTDDRIFGENTWADWIPGSGAMLNVLFGGMVYAASKIPLTSEKTVFSILCSTYGSIFRQFCLRKEVQVQKFTGLGGRQGNDALWEELKRAIDGESQI